MRVYAVSPGSRDILRDLGAWERLDAPCRARAPHGNLRRRRRAPCVLGTPGASLAWILEAGRLTRALEEQVDALDNVQLTRGVAASGFGADASGSWRSSRAASASRRCWWAPMVPIRACAQRSMPAEEEPYGEAAVVANFETESGTSRCAPVVP